jgi:hypothetical protein
MQSQKIARYGEIPNGKNTFDTYIAQNGTQINVGDEITIGLPSSDDGFRFITQGGQKSADFLADRTITISQIRTYKDKRFAGQIYLQFKGYGLIPVDINYETALKAGEIIQPNNLD